MFVLMYSLGFSQGFPGVFLGFSLGFPGVFLGFSQGFPGVFLGFSRGFPGVFTGFSRGFPGIFPVFSLCFPFFLFFWEPSCNLYFFFFFFFYLKKIKQLLQNCIGPTIRIGQEILRFLYAGFFPFLSKTSSRVPVWANVWKKANFVVDCSPE